MQATLEKIEGLPAPRVRLTVKNDGAAHVYLAKDRLCLSGAFDGDYFTVAGKAKYIGPKRNPAPYCNDQLVKLEAGQELAVEIDLARWYKLAACTAVRYKTNHSSIYKREELESNWVEL